MRKILVKLLILLMAVHAFVPAGFMLGQSADGSGTVSIVICKGDGSGLLRITPDGTPADPASDHHRQTLCPFASFGAIALDLETAQPIAVPVAYHQVRFARPVTPVHVDTVWRRPSARAPPAQA